MIETWQQYTCDACGMTEYTDEPGYTKTRLKTELKESGWKNTAISITALNAYKKATQKRVSAK